VQSISVTSPRITSPRGLHAGMTVAELLAAGERIDVEPWELTFPPTEDETKEDSTKTPVEYPHDLRVFLRREGLVGEAYGEEGLKWARRLARVHDPVRALDSAMRIDALTAERSCP
jgi:hypothetical protein